jgi:hypothetical protein
MDYSKCIHCEQDKAILLFVDPLKCLKCGEDVNVEYWNCSACNGSWRSINGVVVDPNCAITVDATPEDLEKLFNSSLIDSLHRCVECNAIAVEVRPGYFKCTECPCEWEIQNSDE